MRNFIKHAACGIAFFAGLALLLTAASWVMVPKDNGRDDGMQDPMANGILSEPKNTIDVLIMGDSETYCSMIPLKIWEDHGITTYCCGTPAQKLFYSQELLQKAFKRQSPKIVILETNAIFRQFSCGDILLRKAGAIFPVFNYNDRWKSLKSHDLRFSIKYTHVDNTKGYLYGTKVDEASTDGYMKETEEIAPIPPQNREYVESIKACCKENGAKLILLSTPSTMNWNMARHNSIKKLAKELHLKYIDMNLMQKQIPIDWKKDTRDKGDHLNHYGAEKVTTYLGGYLSDTGLLHNHREDRDYDRWNDALKIFNNTLSDPAPKRCEGKS